MAEHALKLVFVFDGAPPVLKAQELARRRAVKVEFERARDEALARRSRRGVFQSDDDLASHA